jgi:anti-sigma factor RsiW
MKCGRIKILLSEYIDGGLSAMQNEEISLHLSRCSNCAREYDSLISTTNELNEMGGASAPWDFWPDVQKRIEIAALKPDWRLAIARIFRIPVVRLSSAATALAIIAVTLWVFFSASVPFSQQPETRFYSEYVRAYSQYRSQQPLADADALTASAELANVSSNVETAE